MKVLALVVVSFAALGCVKPAPPHAPPAYAGTVPLTIVNGTSHLLCQYVMMGVGMGKPQRDNWLGSTVLEARKQLEFHVQPGTYSVRVEGCNGTFVGSTTIQQAIRVDGPTWLSVGDAPRPPTGFASARVEVHRPAPVRAAPAEEEPGGEEPAGSASCKPDGAVISDGADSHLCCGQHSTGVTRNLRNLTLCCSDMQSCNTLK